MIGWIVRKIHGDRRSGQGFLLLKQNYVLPDQERALGWSYIGLLGFIVCAAVMGYLRYQYGPGPRQFGFWRDLPSDLRVAVVVAPISFVIGWVAGFRLRITQTAIRGQPLSDLE